MVRLEDALNVARALKQVPATGGGCARLYDESGGTACVVSWAPADQTACVLVPNAGPNGNDSYLAIPAAQL